LFVRNLFLISLAVFLSSCGFEPLYGPNSTQAPVVCEELAQVKIACIKDREGQILRNHLIELLTPNGQPTFPTALLTVGLGIIKAGLSVRRDGTNYRYQLTLTAQLTLKDATTKKVLYTDTAKVINAYYISDLNALAAYATTIAEKDAREKGLKLLAEQIQLLLASYYKQRMMTGHENPKTS